MSRLTCLPWAETGSLVVFLVFPGNVSHEYIFPWLLARPIVLPVVEVVVAWPVVLPWILRPLVVC
jgi:hypothetical protein